MTFMWKKNCKPGIKFSILFKLKHNIFKTINVKSEHITYSYQEILDFWIVNSYLITTQDLFSILKLRNIWTLNMMVEFTYFIVFQLVPRALQVAIEEDVDFRKGLPRDYLNVMGIANSDVVSFDICQNYSKHFYVKWYKQSMIHYFEVGMTGVTPRQ